jgi:aryl-alcohol dehydrogenase-like predicted oxidoreductase
VNNDRLILGTAQLGSAYGIANRSGQPDDDTMLSLVRAAVDSGISRFDTAAAYGNSEGRLGEAFTSLELNGSVSVTSKGSIAGVNAVQLEEVVAASLHNLQVERLESWLLHREEEILNWSDSFHSQAIQLTKSGRIGSFGVSVYRLDVALTALKKGCFDAIQCPANPFDRRFLRCRQLREFAERGGKVALRSIYLQGLCLMDPFVVPDGIKHGRKAISVLLDFCARHDVERDSFCLHYVMHRSAQLRAAVVIGCESVEQLLRNVELLESEKPQPELFDQWDQLWPEDLEPLIFPFVWNLRKN